MGNNRNAFNCPGALPQSYWDTNVNQTLSGPSGQLKLGENGQLDSFAILESSRFSLGYNDWGLNNNLTSVNNTPIAPFGMGADVGTIPVKDSSIRSPVNMIVMGDVRSDLATVDFNANLDPVIGDAADNDPATHAQCPSNRHNYRTDLQFADGHVETPKRNDIINPLDNFWRSKWNNDNDPHLPGSAVGVGNWTLSNVSALEQ